MYAKRSHYEYLYHSTALNVKICNLQLPKQGEDRAQSSQRLYILNKKNSKQVTKNIVENSHKSKPVV